MENAVANAVVVKVVLDHLHPHSAVENVVENAVANAVVVQNSRFMGVVVQILQMMRNRCMGVARRIITSRAWYLATADGIYYRTIKDVQRCIQ